MADRDDIRLRWVLADPSRERAVDPIGMGSQGDRIADILLPQLSVATTRARYLSFLCWAVDKSAGSPSMTRMIHRLEAEFAIEEAERHRRDDPASDCPGVVGRGRALEYLKTHDWNPPKYAERLYKNTAFATYRPTMRGLGLLTYNRTPTLTDEGKQLAAIFQACRGRRPRCLGDISKKEQGRLRGLLGLDYRMQVDGESKRRRATYEVVCHDLPHRDSASILERHAQISSRPTDVSRALHRAFVWELLSCGLTLAFSWLLVTQRTTPIVTTLRRELSKRPRRQSLGPLSPSDPECGGQVVAFLRAALKLNPSKLDLDQGPIQLAARLIEDRDPPEFLRQLVACHRRAKLESPWVALVGNNVEILAPKKNLYLVIRPRTYRLDAFGQLLRDLGMLP
jgi:hypothetical protein